MSNATQSQSLSDDIAFIRSMVDEGRSGSFRGEIGVAAGLIWGTASLYGWAVWTKVLDFPGATMGLNWSWLVATIAFLIAGVPLGMYRRSSNRAAATLWASLGISCWILAMVIGIAAWRTHMGMLWALLPPIIMSLYGGAWLVSAAVCRRYWMTGVGIVSLLSSLLLAYTVARPVEYLLFALCIYFLGAAPSLYGLLRRRSAANA